MRMLSLYVCIVVFSTACTITDEVSPQLDVTEPNVTITVNGLTAYSSLHSNWQAISCDDGSIPGFVPDGSGLQGVTVPIDEDLLTPVFPLEINVLAGDPGAGIRQIRVVVPPGPVSSSDAQTTSYQGYSQVLQNYTPPYASARAITYSYSRLNTNKIRHEFQLRDAANTWNEFRFQMDIAPESEVCS